MKSTVFFLVLCLSWSSTVESRTVFQSLLGNLQKGLRKDKKGRSSSTTTATATDNKNNVDDAHRRLLEMGGRNNNVDLDAATGTVPHVETPEEKAAKEKAQAESTCDGQMAVAMVQANERQAVAEKERDDALKEHAAAVNKIVDLQALLVQMENKLADSATALKETKEQAKEKLQATEEKAVRDQNALKEEKANALKQEKERHREEMTALKEDKDEIIDTLQKKLKMTSKDLQTTLQEELEKARADRDGKLANLQSKMDTAVAELEKDRDTLQQQMETAAADAAKLLETTKDEAKTYMVTQVNAVKSKLAQVEAEHDKTNTEKNRKIKNLQDHTQKVLDRSSGTEKELDEAREELDHWRTLHESRSYCNMTHVATDLYDASAHVARRSVDTGKTLFAKSKDHAGKVYQEQMEKHWPTIEPHYEKHVKGNYKKHVEPHLEKHVYPRMEQLSTWYKQVAVPRVQKADKDMRQGYKNVIRRYAEECKSTFKAYKAVSKEKEFLKKHPLPKEVLEAWSNSCANPEETIEAAMYGILLLLGVIFHRRIFRLIWWTINIALSILLTVTPLGLIFKRRGSAKPGKRVKIEDGEDAIIPDVARSSSDSPVRGMASPSAPSRNTRSAKKTK